MSDALDVLWHLVRCRLVFLTAEGSHGACLERGMLTMVLVVLLKLLEQDYMHRLKEMGMQFNHYHQKGVKLRLPFDVGLNGIPEP